MGAGCCGIRCAADRDEIREEISIFGSELVIFKVLD